MNRSEWSKFVKARDRFRDTTEKLAHSLPKLKDIQQELADSRSGTAGAGSKNISYTVETPVVYNTALDEITIKDEIRLILVADNPGRREQAAENKRYLVGPSGKIAKKFFSGNPALGIDFTKNVIILNKTPVHTPRTGELRELSRLETHPCLQSARSGQNARSGNNKNGINAAIIESQKIMASLLLEFHEALGSQVWITGYSEMKKGGIFETYTNMVKELYAEKKELYKNIYLFRHFSMNQFTIDLKQQALPGETIIKTLNRIGTAYRKRILGS